MKILIVEDESDLAQVLADYLKRDGYQTMICTDGGAALPAVARFAPDLMLLDIMLPNQDGLSILRELRKTSELPVILVTARVEELDRLLGLELGADDYVCKPYSPREVVARVKAVLRRQRPDAQAQTEPPLLEIDADGWRAKLAGQRLDLTPREFRLLQVLADKPGRVLSRAQLLDHVCDDSLDVSERAIDSHMKNLRRKLAQALPEREVIRSIYGVGFVFDI
jgi:two-component system, OmpR family, response regulator BaeR